MQLTLTEQGHFYGTLLLQGAEPVIRETLSTYHGFRRCMLLALQLFNLELQAGKQWFVWSKVYDKEADPCAAVVEDEVQLCQLCRLYWH